MAKKKGEVEEHRVEVEPPQVPKEELPRLSEVVRKALGQLGLDASIGEVKVWISENYSRFRFNESTLSQTLSLQRKKLRDKEGGGAAASAPTIDALLRVRELAEEHGGTESLLKMVQTVHDASAEVGDMRTLLRCLEVLHKLSGK